jgi:hypothetical protein
MWYLITRAQLSHLFKIIENLWQKSFFQIICLAGFSALDVSSVQYVRSGAFARVKNLLLDNPHGTVKNYLVVSSP